MDPLFVHFLELWRPLGYVLAFVGIAIEGDIVLFIVAILAHQGFFDIGDILMVSCAAALFGDLMWYRLGYHLSQWFPKFHERVARIAKPFDNHLQSKPLRTLFISKFTYGIHRVVLLRAGVLGISPLRFLKMDAPLVLMWAVIIIAIGYLTSLSISAFRHYLRFVQIIIFLSVVIFFLVWRYIVTPRFTKRL